MGLGVGVGVREGRVRVGVTVQTLPDALQAGGDVLTFLPWVRGRVRLGARVKGLGLALGKGEG